MTRLMPDMAAVNAYNAKVRTVAGYAGAIKNRDPQEKPKQERTVKYRNKSVNEGGMSFDSQRERMRYRELWLMECGGLIRDLKHHPAYLIEINGQPICGVEPDYEYVDVKTGKKVVEDVKPNFITAEAKRRYHQSPAYKMFRLKKKLMAAVFGIDVIEI